MKEIHRMPQMYQIAKQSEKECIDVTISLPANSWRRSLRGMKKVAKLVVLIAVSLGLLTGVFLMGYNGVHNIAYCDAQTRCSSQIVLGSLYLLAAFLMLGLCWVPSIYGIKVVYQETSVLPLPVGAVVPQMRHRVIV
jgi:hypothetical protein